MISLLLKRHMMLSTLLSVIVLLSACAGKKVMDAGPIKNETSLRGKDILRATLDSPENSDQRRYLGIKENHFVITDISSQVVLVQIFDMYCPHCQKDAPNMNEFYKLLNSSRDYSDKIKIIGIGAGNTRFEVDFFRQLYDIKFPLFPDPDFKISDLIGNLQTPYFIGIRLNKDKVASIFLSEAGGGRDPEIFLKQIVSLAGVR